MKSRFKNRLLVRLEKSVKVGLLVVSVWAIMCCIYSAFVGSLANSYGVLLLGVRVGNTSRYLDPFVMGIFAAVLAWLWGTIPPNHSKDNDSIELCLIGALIFVFLQLTMRQIVWDFLQVLDSSKVFVSSILFILLTPFSFRGAMLNTFVCSLGLLVVQGSVPAVLFATIVYVGKWVIWWLVNVTRYGFKGARNALGPKGGASAVQ